MSARQTAASLSRSNSTQLQQAKHKSGAGPGRSSRLRHVNTSKCTLDICRQFRLVYNSRRLDIYGATESCRIRVRLHDDFFICIASSGRKHGGDITIIFQDATGAASSCGEWRPRRETPDVPISLCGLVRLRLTCHCSLLCVSSQLLLLTDAYHMANMHVNMDISMITTISLHSLCCKARAHSHWT